MVRKKFGISPSVNKALTQTIKMAEAENSNFMNTEILLERIKLDPDNPRKHRITLRDITEGISRTDPLRKEKEEELENLSQLSASIEKEGLLHPIIVVEEENDFRLVAGERRYLASLLSKRQIIEARVFKKRPKKFDLKVIQWSENQSRKDLSLYKKLMNVNAILEVYDAENSEPLTAIALSALLGVSRQQAQFFKAILSNPTLVEFIKDEKIKTMEIARQLTQASGAEITSFLASDEAMKKSSPKMPTQAKAKSNQPAKKRTSIDLGSTNNPEVAKQIVNSVIDTMHLTKYASHFKAVDWHCFDASTKAFQQLITLLEHELEVMV